MSASPTFHFLGSTGTGNEAGFESGEPRMKEVLRVGIVVFGGGEWLSRYIPCL